MSSFAGARPDLRQVADTWASWLGDLGDRIGGWEWVAHLTFKNPIGWESAVKKHRAWLVELNRECFGRRYSDNGTGVAFTRAHEYQERGVLHFHDLIGGGVGNVHRFSYMRKWEQIGGGWARIFPYDPQKGSLAYVTKIMRYVTKESDIEVFLPRVHQDHLVEQPLKVHRD